MLSINECKKILNQNERKYTDAEVKKIIELFSFWAKLEYETYLKKKNHG